MVLTDLRARKIKAGDKPVSDGTVSGLYLFASALAGKGKWVLRFVSPETGKRRDMGLGTYPMLPIKDARSCAFSLRQMIDKGLDPIEERLRSEAAERAALDMPDFETAARALHADLVAGYRNAKHRDQWINTLQTYVFPRLGQRPVNALTARDFAACLKPIWLSKAETASRVKQRCDAVMTWCAARGHIVASPVGVVEHLLPKQPGKRERVDHQPAMPWQALPDFCRTVLHYGPPVRSKLMLEVLILTAARSGEVRSMTWDEIDLEAGVWTVPASRMKAKVVHRVPLGPHLRQLLAALKERAEDEQPLVFASTKGTPVCEMSLTKFLRDTGIASDTTGRFATAHGFRSTFRDWASEHGYPRDLAERALAHTIKNASEAAYHRTDLLDQRRPMMEAYEAFVLATAMTTAAERGGTKG